MINTLQETDRITALIRDSFRQSDKHTAVIALSGGIDSALSLVLTATALGPEQVHAFYLPAKSSNSIHLRDCRLLISSFQLPASNFHILPIGAIIQKTRRIINKSQETSNKIQVTRNKLRLANLAARIRMMVIFDQAKTWDALVIGTENYSEHLLGYYTRFGDEASDLEPIRHLYKTGVIQLAKQLQLPASIITKPPSADLWPGQTDTKELGFSYDQADPILALIDQHKTNEEIISAGFDPHLTEAVRTQVNRTAFKHYVPYSLTREK